MKYKGKNVNAHRYYQLTKTRENRKERLAPPTYYFHPKAIENLRNKIK